MSSSRALAMCELMARGVKYEFGSMEETFARVALERDRSVRYAETLAVVNAIIEVGNALASAVTGSPAPQSTKGSGLKKVMESLRSLLMPELAERTERDAEKAKAVLAAEIEKGPITIRSMAYSRRRGRKKKH